MHPFPALVLLDLNLPEMPGFEVLKRIRENPAHAQLPVVVFTSSEREEDRARAHELGASDFLKKPNLVAGFEEAVRRISSHVWTAEGAK